MVQYYEACSMISAVFALRIKHLLSYAIGSLLVLSQSVSSLHSPCPSRPYALSRPCSALRRVRTRHRMTDSQGSGLRSRNHLDIHYATTSRFMDDRKYNISLRITTLSEICFHGIRTESPLGPNHRRRTYMLTKHRYPSVVRPVSLGFCGSDTPQA